jgi:CheY-like chemotaxis protein
MIHAFFITSVLFCHVFCNFANLGLTYLVFCFTVSFWINNFYMNTENNDLSAEESANAALVDLHKDNPERGVVLGVDDMDIMRLVIRTLVNSILKSFDVVIAVNGQEAYEIAEANCGRIALIISDVKMPKRNGPELAKAVRELDGGKAFPIILASGDNRSHQIDELLKQGVVDGFIEKPFNLENIGDTIKAAIKSRLAVIEAGMDLEDQKSQQILSVPGEIGL